MARKEKILIVGAGLCGSLLAIRMAQRGYEVEVHERLPDMRKIPLAGGRSINLALSDRGLKAIKSAGFKEEILEECIGMEGRMIHGIDGEERFSKYSGREGEKINSVSRTGLNITLLDKADEFDNVTIHFNSKCVNIDLDNATGSFINFKGKKIQVKATIVLGTDGAGSVVRKSMMSRTPELLFNYSQNFLRSGYKELEIPATDTGGYRLDKNALHIWPRGKFMMIALPNLDGSFTVTMFHPYEGESGFNTLNTEEKVLGFFKKYYPDSLKHFPNLTEEYFNNPVGMLGTIKCYPWQAFGKTLIMGDAAHAIVPFYGQGMNASFEDVRIFDEMVEKHNGNWEALFKEFQEERVNNTNAIADLAVDNFYEMQDKVADEVFIRKRKIEMQLEQTYPDYYSKYSLVTFQENLSYREAMIRGRKQDELLLKICSDSDWEKISLDSIYQKLKKVNYSDILKYG
ncbi:NAD(P)/FAD-dependent oxidoreductase [Croceitalea sp. MTPC9]|uniref:FAD-dependent oxidoreductase n=1 Tax=unclassified Croceitalea TaxID=2632280 RepID=UPI002B3A0932|nr:NAD(P)/FAD-dependent oxidoreductase [Croceitalea sp. MTPC6]GMN15294.1 NAD(P)/FAD-dependent oxidoreductase [Croceitalea sp. MTPC9]